MTIPFWEEEPFKPLTPAEEKVAALAGCGYGIGEIADRIGLERATVASHVYRIALKLTDEEGVAPLARVQLWAAHRVWRQQLLIERASVA